MNYVYSDGGRKNAGFKKAAGDCVCRAIVIAEKRDYKQTYQEICRLLKRRVINGISKKETKMVLNYYGWTWTPTMFFGSGCITHLRQAELPTGILIARVSKHITAIIDGIIYDNHNPSRNGTRCVYGYWTKKLTKRG